MICVIHQPNFLPYLGFFDKILKSDVFIIYDTAQYSKNDFHNRNKIKTISGALWLTVPVSVTVGMQIKDVKIASSHFIKKHLSTIKMNYSKSHFFDIYYPAIEEIYCSVLSNPSLVDFNVKFIKFILEILGYNGKIINSSSLNVSNDLKSTAAIVAMCRNINADIYISGVGAREYLEEQFFSQNNIELRWQNFSHPVYSQNFGAFVPNLSILDAIFNIGPDLKKFLC
jgi:hypothetical protein